MIRTPFLENEAARLVYGILQSLAGFEFRLFGSRNIDFFARTGVTSRGCGAIGNTEGPKADQTNIATLGKG